MHKAFLSSLLTATFLSTSLYAASPPRSNAAANNTATPAPPAKPLASSDSTLFENHSAQAEPPALATLRSSGVKITYLGNDGGASGYLLESNEGKFTPMYLAPSGDYVIVGTMFKIDPGGQSLNVTGNQIAAMKQRIADNRAKQEEEARLSAQAKQDQLRRDALSQQQRLESAQQQLNTTLPGLNTGAQDNRLALPQTPPAPPPVLIQSAPDNSNTGLPKPDASLPVPITPSTPAVATNDSANTNSDPAQAAISYRVGSLPGSSGAISKEDFLSKIDSVAWFPIGSNTAPVVYMFADPQCEFCHAAWQQLKPMIDAKKILVRIIAFDGKPSSEPLNINLFMLPNPSVAWYNGVGSAAKPEKGYSPLRIPTDEEKKTKEYSDALNYLTRNQIFATGFDLKQQKAVSNNLSVKQTPTFVYVGKDGNMYSMSGANNLSNYLSAL